MKKSGQVLVRTMSSKSGELPKDSGGMSGVLNLFPNRIRSKYFARSVMRLDSLWSRSFETRVARCLVLRWFTHVELRPPRRPITIRSLNRLDSLLAGVKANQ
jgi:hypothetical protein